jgi:AcrR family transcriptional regulator
MPLPTATPDEPLSLREACVRAARELIAERGLEHLSLREVARKLGVSHQAPYKHYPSRDHLLAEVMRRCFEHFAAHLDDRPAQAAPHEDLAALGRQYQSYARAHPLEYRLMFGTPWPEGADEAGLSEGARHAFDTLRQVLRRVHGSRNPGSHRLVELDALYIWSAMHGLAGVTLSDAMPRLGLADEVLDQAVAHVMARVGHGLAAPEASLQWPPHPA